LPNESGFVDRDGVKIYYEIYGNGLETMVFLPPWCIVHSRIYKRAPSSPPVPTDKLFERGLALVTILCPERR
jgi:hypothetical protein